MDELLKAGYRYFVILCGSKEQAERALEEVRRWTGEAGLTLHSEKTRIVDAAEDGFEFLGYRFEKGRRWPRNKSVKKLRAAVRGQTRRTDGTSLCAIIGRINPVLRGWYGYFKHAQSSVMKRVDGWVRMRLRSVLRKRHKLSGRGRGSDHQRWPNVYFAELGLFSLERSHRLACQSMKMVH